MIAVLNIVPVHPGNGIVFQLRVLVRFQLHILRAFVAVDRAAVKISVKIDVHGYPVVRQSVHFVVVSFCICPDRVNIIFLDPVLFGQFLDILHLLSHGNDDIRLLLRVSLVRIAKNDSRILNDLCDDAALRFLARLHLWIKPGICCAVSVHGCISHELADLRHDLVALKKLCKLLVNDIRDLL